MITRDGLVRGEVWKFVNDVKRIVLTVQIFRETVISRFSSLVLLVIGVRIHQAGFASGVIMQESIGGYGMTRLVEFRINSPDGPHCTVDILLIEDDILAHKADTRFERISVIINGVLVDSSIRSRIVVYRFSQRLHPVG